MISVTASKHLVRAWLQDDPAIDAVAKVYGAHLNSADAGTVLTATPIVVFEFLSGTGRYNREFQTPVMETYVYSKGSATEAADVYDLVYTRLQGARMQVAGIGPCGTAREVERPIDGWREDIGAWFLRSRWSLSIVAGP